MASTGRAAPSSPGPRHSSPPRPPSLPPLNKTGFQHGAEGAAGSWAAPAALGTLAASSPVLLHVWALWPRPTPLGLSCLSAGRGLHGEVDWGHPGYYCNLKVALGGIQPCVLQVVAFSSAAGLCREGWGCPRVCCLQIQSRGTSFQESCLLFSGSLQGISQG